ncbi:methyl-accepting chemotaxis protein [Sneathiella sp.]|jgi:methyl-accepting chemotaxis protein|uniref:methyl-accepting chemotaxis protein n=1 Tax=Sneathiella sp. TaxID=1964365 RepID=UPI0039E263DA
MQLAKKLKSFRNKSDKTEAPKTTISQRSPILRMIGKLGIRARLYVAFGVVAILTTISGTLGVVEFVSLGKTLNTITETSFSAFSKAQRLSQQATGVIESAPLIAAAKTEDNRKRQAENAQKALVELIESVKEAKNSSNEGDIEQALANLDMLGFVLEDLALSVVKRNELEKKLKIDLDTVTSLEQEIQGLVEPVINAETSALGMSSQMLSAAGDIQKVKAGMRKILSRDVRLIQRLIQFSADANAVVSSLYRAANQQSPEEVEERKAEFLLTGAKLKTIAFLPKFKGKDELRKATNSLYELGNRDDSIFALRKNYLSTVAEIRAAENQAATLATALEYVVEDLVAATEANSIEAVAKANVAIERNSNLLIGIAVLSVVIALLIAWLYVGRNLMRRLNQFVADMRSIADGNLDTEVSVSGNDEIAVMGHALVGFRDNAKEAEIVRANAEAERQKREADKAQAEREAAEAEKRAQVEKERLEQEAEQTKRAEMNQLADDFEGSVKHLVESFAVATSNMNDTSRNMSEAADETSSRSQTVASASDLASSSVHSVASATEELSASISEISRQVSQAASIAGEAVSEAERTNVMVTSLNDAAAKIGDVVGLINDIAGQTNLLALNATIEAARAGDAGKGFAVVASEVKNLATQTAKATEEISGQIRAVQEETTNAVGAIGGISSTIGRINEIATTIASAVDEQGAATGEISRSVQQAAQSTQEVSHNIGSVSQAAQTTGQSASQVQDVATELSREVNSLDSEVQRFLERVRAS